MRFTFTCWSCQQETEMETRVFRSHRCRNCGAAMLSCRNCRFYDPHASKQCREPVSEPVSDKEKANFCDYYQPGGSFGENEAAKKVEEAKNKLDSLFKF